MRGGGSASPNPGTTLQELVSTALASNLYSKSHWLRLHTIRLINGLRPWSADGNRSGDGGGNAYVQSAAEKNTEIVLRLCEEAEGLPLTLAAEREFVIRLSKIEVIFRTSNDLPDFVARAAASHCLGPKILLPLYVN